LTISFRPNYFNKTDFKLTINNTFNRVKQDDLSIEKFKSEFFLKNYFTKKNCSLEEFSEIMGVSNEAINLYIYEQYGLSFSDFVNKQRVELFIATIKDKKINELTIEALAEMVGFGSRPTLYRAFKKHHGGNPTDLIKAVS